MYIFYIQIYIPYTTSAVCLSEGDCIHFIYDNFHPHHAVGERMPKKKLWTSDFLLFYRLPRVEICQIISKYIEHAHAQFLYSSCIYITRPTFDLSNALIVSLDWFDNILFFSRLKLFCIVTMSDLNILNKRPENRSVHYFNLSSPTTIFICI